jgi:hypothetical protein
MQPIAPIFFANLSSRSYSLSNDTFIMLWEQILFVLWLLLWDFEPKRVEQKVIDTESLQSLLEICTKF